MAAPQDTRADVWTRQVEGFRAMPPCERLRARLAMTDEVNETARWAVRLGVADARRSADKSPPG